MGSTLDRRWSTLGRRLVDAWSTLGRRLVDAWSTLGRRWSTRGRSWLRRGQSLVEADRKAGADRKAEGGGGRCTARRVAVTSKGKYLVAARRLAACAGSWV